ncbi:MAG: ATP synthase F1 subunit epsilon [Elusimicrobia bacterium RIFCSPLOWO2_02_FULL_39_32]|nr:MAG: ATP synthase F1 subunit epsilon [Elusimicrobia bacterium GWA2_38_7]OGR78450.1 MAG: ATP synthase F1 subunit epsilon [Elusimicrobia bacterium RIFCSPHIGHO2_02_FULL_39_36]OGR92209.1 MAG: ATP synthase F1 subunit epsilon [Elusimicrobia bacterium RIFCSPLOWO2_02_FULL_39_32]OGR99924.1 MAG: ATP synthase F1 subunit epsilon [Elusimicrobia bacterium RIFCSPLOWO2_12_FULL_39_28]
MLKKINLEVISPERLVLQEEVDFIALPAFEGECGILPGHQPMLVQLKEGEARFSKGNETEILAVSGGFAEIHPYKVEIFAETAEMSKEIDMERARVAAERAKKELEKETISPKELANAQAALRRALIRLRVSEGMSRRASRKK